MILADTLPGETPRSAPTKQVPSGGTGHTEAVQVADTTSKVTYGRRR